MIFRFRGGKYPSLSTTRWLCRPLQTSTYGERDDDLTRNTEGPLHPRRMGAGISKAQRATRRIGTGHPRGRQMAVHTVALLSPNKNQHL